MSREMYVLPQVRNYRGYEDALEIFGATYWGPAYWNVMDRFGCQDFGAERYCLAWVEATEKNHATIQEDPLVLLIPQPFEDPVGPVLLARLQKTLGQDIGLPEDKVDETMSCRSLIQVLTKMASFFQVLHRVQGDNEKTLGTVSLDSQMKDISADTRTAIEGTLTALNVDLSTRALGSETLRDVLNGVVDKRLPFPLYMNGDRIL